MKMIRIYLTILFACLGMLAKSQTTKTDTDSLQVDSTTADTTTIQSAIDTSDVESMLRYARQYIGKPYSYGSTSGKSFDCSGFTQHVYSKYNTTLPHSSASQADICEKVKPQKAQKGDLIFFTGRSSKSKKVGHVAIVTEVDGKRIRMIHATVHGGVMEEWYNDSDYFNKRFLFVGRIKSK